MLVWNLSVLDDIYVGQVCIVICDYNELLPFASILARAKKELENHSAFFKVSLYFFILFLFFDQHFRFLCDLPSMHFANHDSNL